MILKSNYFYSYFNIDNSNYLLYNLFINGKRRWLRLSSKKVPRYQPMTKFLRGQASKIFNEVAKEDNVVIVLKNSKPQNVIISYEKYEELKNKGVDI